MRTFVPPMPFKGILRRMILFSSFIISSLLALPLVGEVDVVWGANPNIVSVIPVLAFSWFKRCPIVLNVALNKHL